jgi:hypothetical protein
MAVLFKYTYVICFVNIGTNLCKTEATIMSSIALWEVLFEEITLLFNKIA